MWDEIKTSLKNQMTRQTFDQWIEPTTAETMNGTLIIHTINEQARDWINAKLLATIARTVAATAPHIQNIDVVVNGSGPPPELVEVQVQGTYSHEYTSTVKPEQVEVHTQYFRRVWRPRLGPLLSELVRELRQRCYYGRGQDQTRRNSCEVTQAELARCLGVSYRTLKRAIQRNESGSFENEYLGLFITEVETVTRYDEDKKRVVNDRTRFILALDEPVLPISSKGHFGP